jgi:hypothetical protein
LRSWIEFGRFFNELTANDMGWVRRIRGLKETLKEKDENEYMDFDEISDTFLEGMILSKEYVNELDWIEIMSDEIENVIK